MTSFPVLQLFTIVYNNTIPCYTQLRDSDPEWFRFESLLPIYSRANNTVWRALNLAILAKTPYFKIWRILNLANFKFGDLILDTNDVTAMS